ncbi:MAG: AAA family ATPase [Sphingobacteriaceae bacterium]|nr:AAA family ATPase [Sphingobacteriaceae bacterium]
MEFIERTKKILESIKTGIYEKDAALSMAFLTAMAGESIFLLGPPGVAKSLISRRLTLVFKDSKHFEYLMSRYSTPEEIFGPISISKLKNEDKYERNIEGYLPKSDVVFLDEIWKAGPSIQNTLLTVINEKKFRNGNQEVSIPLKLLISASNELPAKDQGLEALWDRFLVRIYVDNIESIKSFQKMILDTQNIYDNNIVDESIKINNDEYNTFRQQINDIQVEDVVINVILLLKEKIQLHNAILHQNNNQLNIIYVSDRKWRKIVNLLRTSAFLNGRNIVNLMDCFLIPYCLWETTEQLDILFSLLKDVVEKSSYSQLLNIGALEEAIQNLKDDVKLILEFGIATMSIKH